MGNVIRRTIILKEVDNFSSASPLSAIVKIESAAFGGLTATVKAINFELSEKHELCIATNDDVIILKPLEEQFFNLDIQGCISVGIFSDDNLLLFGQSGKSAPTAASLKNSYKEKKNHFFNSAEITQEIYDDERIATENYYDNQPISEDFYVSSQQNNRNAQAEKQNLGHEKEEQFSKEAFLNEAFDEPCKEQNSQCTDFYSTVREQIKTLFLRGSRETDLERVLPCSRFTRINYSIDKYYIVGIIEEDDKPKYICYGVPGKYCNPPEKLKGIASFVPLSLFNLAGSGYFVMFQSALSGERVELKTDLFGL